MRMGRGSVAGTRMLMPLSWSQECVAAGRRRGEPSHHVPPWEECGHAPNLGGTGGSCSRELSMGAWWDGGGGVQQDQDWREGWGTWGTLHHPVLPLRNPQGSAPRLMPWSTCGAPDAPPWPTTAGSSPAAGGARGTRRCCLTTHWWSSCNEGLLAPTNAGPLRTATLGPWLTTSYRTPVGWPPSWTSWLRRSWPGGLQSPAPPGLTGPSLSLSPCCWLSHWLLPPAWPSSPTTTSSKPGARYGGAVHPIAPHPSAGRRYPSMGGPESPQHPESPPRRRRRRKAPVLAAPSLMGTSMSITTGSTSRWGARRDTATGSGSLWGSSRLWEMI